MAAIVQVTGYEDISFSAGEYVAPENRHEEALPPDEIREIQASPAYIPSLTRFEVKFEHVIWGETPKEPTAYVLQAGGYAHEKAYSHYGSLLEVGKTYLVMLEEMALNPGSYYDSPMGIYEIVEGRLEALVPAGTAAAVEMLDGTRLSDAVSLVQQAGEAVAPKDPFNEVQP